MDLLDHCEDYEKELKNNHASFDSFGWSGPEDKEEWCIVYTSNRDSETLTKSNAEVTDQMMEPLLGDYCESIRSSHWGHGYLDGFLIRCRNKEGEFSDPFKKWVEICLSLSDYGALDDSHYSEMQLEESFSQLTDYIHYNNNYSDLELPGDWQSHVYSGLSEKGIVDFYDSKAVDQVIDEVMNDLGFFSLESYEDDDLELCKENDELFLKFCAIAHLSLIFKNLNSYRFDFDLMKWYSDSVVKELLNG